jgi:glycosyltransferase involved in cell wall biosynthesis
MHPRQNTQARHSATAFKYSLVIATLHDDGELEKCLTSMLALADSPTFEVIVIDQNGDDRLVDLLRRFADCLSIVHERVTFRAACRARNLGVRLAKSTWVGFPDDDCQLMPDTLQEVDRLTSHFQASVITGQTVDTSGVPNVLRWKKESVNFTRWTMFGCLTEATLFVRRDAFLKVDGFDERFGPGARFPAAEGIDLVNRLFADLGDGHEVACYSPRIRMIHPTKIPPWNRWAVSRFYSYAHGDGGLIAKNLQPHMLYWGARTIVAASLQVLSMRGWRSVAFAARLAGLFKGFFAGLLVFHIGGPR